MTTLSITYSFRCLLALRLVIIIEHKEKCKKLTYTRVAQFPLCIQVLLLHLNKGSSYLWFITKHPVLLPQFINNHMPTACAYCSNLLLENQLKILSSYIHIYVPNTRTAVTVLR